MLGFLLLFGQLCKISNFRTKDWLVGKIHFEGLFTVLESTDGWNILEYVPSICLDKNHGCCHNFSLQM